MRTWGNNANSLKGLRHSLSIHCKKYVYNYFYILVFFCCNLQSNRKVLYLGFAYCSYDEAFIDVRMVDTE